MIVRCECGKVEIRAPYYEPDKEIDGYCLACLEKHFPHIMPEVQAIMGNADDKLLKFEQLMDELDEALGRSKFALGRLKEACNGLFPIQDRSNLLPVR